MPFGYAAKLMTTTKLWQIIQEMPKGALLHAHFEAMVDVRWLIDEVMQTPGMAIVAGTQLCTIETMEAPPVSFRYIGREDEELVDLPDDPNIWSPQYVPGTPVHVWKAAKTFPGCGNGEIQDLNSTSFRDWVVRSCTIEPELAQSPHRSIPAVWAKFSRCFPIIVSMWSYEPIFRQALCRILEELFKNGIQWVEFRLTFVFQFRQKGNTEPDADYNPFLTAFREELAAFRAKEGHSHFWGARIIWSGRRIMSMDGIIADMEKCVVHKQRFPDLICGYDLVGREDGGRSLADLTPEILQFRSKCKSAGVTIPFFFHAGECLGDGDSTDFNLVDAILFDTRRIGHAYSLYKHPFLIELVKEKDILVECCPLSNEILHLTANIMGHPLPALLSRGVHVAIGNDDPAILGYDEVGLTHDFWQVLQAFESTGLEGLGSMGEDSVRLSAFAPDQVAEKWSMDIQLGANGTGIRAERIKAWRMRWEAFCMKLISAYGKEYGRSKEDVAREKDIKSEGKAHIDPHLESLLQRIKISSRDTIMDTAEIPPKSSSDTYDSDVERPVKMNTSFDEIFPNLKESLDQSEKLIQKQSTSPGIHHTKRKSFEKVCRKSESPPLVIDGKALTAEEKLLQFALWDSPQVPKKTAPEGQDRIAHFPVQSTQKAKEKVMIQSETFEYTIPKDAADIQEAILSNLQSSKVSGSDAEKLGTENLIPANREARTKPTSKQDANTKGKAATREQEPPPEPQEALEEPRAPEISTTNLAELWRNLKEGSAPQTEEVPETREQVRSSEPARVEEVPQAKEESRALESSKVQKVAKSPEQEEAKEMSKSTDQVKEASNTAGEPQLRKTPKTREELKTKEIVGRNEQTKETDDTLTDLDVVGNVRPPQVTPPIGPTPKITDGSTRDSRQKARKKEKWGREKAKGSENPTTPITPMTPKFPESFDLSESDASESSQAGVTTIPMPPRAYQSTKSTTELTPGGPSQDQGQGKKKKKKKNKKKKKAGKKDAVQVEDIIPEGGE